MTPRQRDLLQAIADLTVDGVSPTYDQLRAHIGIASKSGVCRMVKGLERQGFIRRNFGCRQTLQVVSLPTSEAEGGLAARLRSLSDEAFAGALDIVAAEIARRAEAAA